MKEAKYQDNLRLLQEAGAGSEEATAALMLNNCGLVKSIAARFAGRGYELEDLEGLGNIGLLKAIRSFDLARGCAFSTYAVPLIFGEIRRFLRDDGPVKVPRTQKRLGAMLMAERDRLLAEGREDVSIAVLAQACGVSTAEAASALDAVCPVKSLSDVIGGEEDGLTLESILSDEEQQEREFNHIALAAAIEKLPPLRRKIILLRYFRDYSQERTAKALGLTQVKVSREEKKILAFLHQELS